MNAPYRHHEQTLPTAPRWWAGWIGYAGLVLSVFLCLATAACAYDSESLGIVASYPTAICVAFTTGCLVVARRTRYSKSTATRVAAPLATGFVCAHAVLLLLFLFFGVAWKHL